MESAEHLYLGDQVTLQFDSSRESAKGLPLSLPLANQPTPRTLTYGQLVALAGDFFGVVGSPISTSTDRRAVFGAAFQSIGNDWGQNLKILAVMEEEITAVRRAMEEGKQPSTAYAMLGDTLSLKWNVITGGSNVGGLPVKMGRYLALAAENWDHFTGYAVTAYKIGHSLAMEHAILAAKQEPAQRRRHLEQAYAINAFADHFLTDLFSAGHMRVPRRELYQQVTTPVPGFSGSLGSLLARCMHDEDCKNGLVVHNNAGKTWTAYGDKRLRDTVSKDNLDMATAATQASADDVWTAFKTGQGNLSAAKFIPNLSKVADPGTKENYSPLFLNRNGQADRRNDVHNRQDFSWTNDWWGWSTYYLLMEQPYTTVKCYRVADNSFLGWLGVVGNNYAAIVGNINDAAKLKWYVGENELYLRKQTASTYDRYLGEGSDSYADWGLWTGNYAAPVLYHADQTLTLKAAPARKLYLHTGNQLRWSKGEANLDFVRIELPLG